jgi:hypothetical protein
MRHTLKAKNQRETPSLYIGKLAELSGGGFSTERARRLADRGISRCPTVCIINLEQ